MINPVIVKLGLMLVSRKLNSNPKDPKNSDFDVKELKKAAPAWVAIAAFIVYLLSSMGYIDPELSKAITTLISNPEVQSAVQEMAD